MTTGTNRIEEIFQDARDLQADALVLAKTVEQMERTPESASGSGC